MMIQIPVRTNAAKPAGVKNTTNRTSAAQPSHSGNGSARPQSRPAGAEQHDPQRNREPEEIIGVQGIQRHHRARAEVLVGSVDQRGGAPGDQETRHGDRAADQRDGGPEVALAAHPQVLPESHCEHRQEDVEIATTTMAAISLP